MVAKNVHFDQYKLFDKIKRAESNLLWRTLSILWVEKCIHENDNTWLDNSINVDGNICLKSMVQLEATSWLIDNLR